MDKNEESLRRYFNSPVFRHLVDTLNHLVDAGTLSISDLELAVYTVAKAEATRFRVPPAGPFMTQPSAEGHA